MGSTINLRIEQLISVLKMSNNAFAKSIGKTSTTINQIVSGRNNPSFDVLDAICSVHHVSPAWLLQGDGEIFGSKEVVKEVEKLADQYLIDHVKQLEDSFSNLAQQLAIKDRQLDGLQRTVDALLMGKYKGVMKLTSRRIRPLYPELEKEA